MVAALNGIEERLVAAIEIMTYILDCTNERERRQAAMMDERPALIEVGELLGGVMRQPAASTRR